MKGIGNSFSNRLILKSKQRYKEVGGMISNSEKMYIWKLFSPPIKAVVFSLLTSIYTILNYLQDKLKRMHTHANPQLHTSVQVQPSYNERLQHSRTLIPWDCLILRGNRRPSIYFTKRLTVYRELGRDLVSECGMWTRNQTVKRESDKGCQGISRNWSGTSL